MKYGVKMISFFNLFMLVEKEGVAQKFFPLTSVPQLSLLSKWIQFNAAPKRIEPQKRAWSHLKDFKKSFQMKPSSFLWLNSLRRSIRLNLHG